jgi:hypothetical protein
MDDVVWLWEMAQKIRREAPVRVSVAASDEEISKCWMQPETRSRDLMVNGGTDEEWKAAYQ